MGAGIGENRDRGSAIKISQLQRSYEMSFWMMAYSAIEQVSEALWALVEVAVEAAVG